MVDICFDPISSIKVEAPSGTEIQSAGWRPISLPHLDMTSEAWRQVQNIDVDWSAAPPGPLDVSVRFNLNKLTDVDTVRSKAWVSIGVMFYWTDSRLAGWTGSLPLALWGPSCWLFNALTDLVEIPQDFDLDDIATGRMKRYCRYMCTIDFAQMQLQDFPLDVNAINVTFRTASHWISKDGSKKGDLARGRSYTICPVDETKKEGSLFRLLWAGDLEELKILGVSIEITELPLSKSGQEVTNMFIRFHVARNVSYYFWKVMMPIYLLFCFTLMVFALENNELGDRLSSMITLFLASFAMLYVMEQHLPKTNFLTLIDKVIVLTTFLLVVAASFMVILWRVHKFADAEYADRWAARGVACLGGFYVICNILIFLPAYFRSMHMMRNLSEKNAQHQHVQLAASSSTQKHYLYRALDHLPRS